MLAINCRCAGWMRMIPANNLKPSSRAVFGIAHILAVTEKRLRGESSRRLPAETSARPPPRPANCLRRVPTSRRSIRTEGLRSVAANTFRQFVTDHQLKATSLSSSQNRSLKYLAAESARPHQRRPFAAGISLATSRQPSQAAAARGSQQAFFPRQSLHRAVFLR